MKLRVIVTITYFFKKCRKSFQTSISTTFTTSYAYTITNNFSCFSTRIIRKTSRT